MSSTYRLTARELERRDSLVRRVRPRTAWLRAYEEDARAWASGGLPVPIPLRCGTAGAGIVALTTERSVLFESDYLVGVVRPSDFRAAFGEADAVAIALEGPLPPLALMPGRPARRLNRVVRSILEHEFVHINQMIRGEYPALPARPTVRLLVDWYERTVRAEFEANFIQLATWPDLLPYQEGVTLEGWSAFRGYTQALESVLKLALRRGMASSQLRQLVAYLLTSTRATLQRAAVGRTHVEWIHGSVPALVRHAVSRLEDEEGHAQLARVVTVLTAEDRLEPSGGPSRAKPRSRERRDAAKPR